MRAARGAREVPGRSSLLVKVVRPRHGFPRKAVGIWSLAVFKAGLDAGL